jgi:uncharacterized protein YhjY with autotransporter beta-barrel domain
MTIIGGAWEQKPSISGLFGRKHNGEVLCQPINTRHDRLRKGRRQRRTAGSTSWRGAESAAECGRALSASRESAPARWGWAIIWALQWGVML